MQRLCVIVPAYNEEANIEGVITSLKQVNPAWKVVVVNDGSSDKTAEVAATTGHAVVLSLPCNLGIGGGVQTGFKYANRNDFDIAIQFDGDGQHIASEIPKLIAPILEGTADVVIGSRFLSKSKEGFQSSLARRFGIHLLGAISHCLVHQRITDSTSGFRAYNRRAIALLSQIYPVDYPEPEAIILLGKNGFRMVEIPVVMQERQGGHSSISGFKSCHYMIKVIVAMFIGSLRPPLPPKAF
jgi:glycosyltransferase involved in cell wall biosynthesis